ncbi:hypothetical protein K490DRAFT_59045 [Saccharata proteae CBS 121410]|uniref:Uncharacterized protein n=1 Tax=Saccharata proteae CBS 121410 TaxID=1314787 RepID=A0A9P4HSC5_9PEZI|nr:hypothetical protein K490DRAFT_59045 [Saccharata proteae CBS 121410]
MDACSPAGSASSVCAHDGRGLTLEGAIKRIEPAVYLILHITHYLHHLYHSCQAALLKLVAKVSEASKAPSYKTSSSFVGVWAKFRRCYVARSESGTGAEGTGDATEALVVIQGKYAAHGVEVTVVRAVYSALYSVAIVARHDAAVAGVDVLRGVETVGWLAKLL